MNIVRKIISKVWHNKLLRRILKSNRAIHQLKNEPASSVFGLDRGTPIDRYYIDQFLSKNKQYIKGRILEVADRDYTLKFGSEIIESTVLHVQKIDDPHSIQANLETGEGIADDRFDCFIITQTLPFIYDMKNVSRNIIRLLKPGGVALITAGGITPISRFDMDRWGHYWSFTDLSLKKLFEETVPPENISIETYGNVKSCTFFLYGMAAEEMAFEDIEKKDIDYPLTICAIIRKP